MTNTQLYDALVIGGGPAGLSVATALVRQLHTTVIFDSQAYRNARTSHMHNVATWDHADPAAFRAKALADLQGRYSDLVRLETTVITSAERSQDGTYSLKNDQGEEWRGKTLAFASGVQDVFHDEIKGFEQCWAYGIYHCLFCHGYESRGQSSVGLLVTNAMCTESIAATVEFLKRPALQALRLAKHVIIYTNNRTDLADAVRAAIKHPDISVDSRGVEQLSLFNDGPDILVKFRDGTTKQEGFLVSLPRRIQRSMPLLKQLGLEVTDSGDIKTTLPLNETNLPGVFAAGDAASAASASVVQAMQMGTFAGVGMATYIQAETLNT